MNEGRINKGVDSLKLLTRTHDRRRHGRLTFAVEIGRGETYSSSDWTIYGLDQYERSSVLYGRTRRMFVASFAPGQDGQDEALEALKRAGVKRSNVDVLGGSSHVPIDRIVSHIPDDTDY